MVATIAEGLMIGRKYKGGFWNIGNVLFVYLVAGYMGVFSL